MKYRKDDDNRYRVRFMRSTEELMDTMTVKEFVSYLDENAELEDDADYEYIDGKVVKCKVYDLKETNSSLHKEFLVTEDERLFYWLSLLQKVELVDCEEEKEVKEMEYPISKSKCSGCSACCLVTKDISFALLNENEMYYQCIANAEYLCEDTEMEVQ